MLISEMTFEGARPIESYGPGFFRISGELVHGPALFTARTVRGWGGYADRAALMALAGEIDVLFIGTGAVGAPLPVGLGEALEAGGLGVEAMATAPACRSYNILLGEGRRIALAALPV